MKFAYLGELPVEMFNNIRSIFPDIVGVEIVDEDVVCGIPVELAEKFNGTVGSLFQLIVSAFNNKELLEELFECMLG